MVMVMITTCVMTTYNITVSYLICPNHQMFGSGISTKSMSLSPSYADH